MPPKRNHHHSTREKIWTADDQWFMLSHGRKFIFDLDRGHWTPYAPAERKRLLGIAARRPGSESQAPTENPTP